MNTEEFHQYFQIFIATHTHEIRMYVIKLHFLKKFYNSFYFVCSFFHVVPQNKEFSIHTYIKFILFKNLLKNIDFLNASFIIFSIFKNNFKCIYLREIVNEIVFLFLSFLNE